MAKDQGEGCCKRERNGWLLWLRNIKSTICLFEDKVKVPTFVPINATDDAKPTWGLFGGQQVDIALSLAINSSASCGASRTHAESARQLNGTVVVEEKIPRTARWYVMARFSREESITASGQQTATGSLFNVYNKWQIIIVLSFMSG
jgi:hypothetical protein